MYKNRDEKFCINSHSLCLNWYCVYVFMLKEPLASLYSSVYRIDFIHSHLNLEDAGSSCMAVSYIKYMYRSIIFMIIKCLSLQVLFS